jgi:predicted ATPase/class 3 adenylate cyclase
MSESMQYILLTDIYRSSHLAESFPQQYAEAHARHNEQIEQLCASFGGRVLKGLGDGYLLLFDTPGPCLGCAVAVMRQVDGSASFPGDMPLRLRAACHGGLLREQAGDWYGPPLNRVARIGQVCHPGQLLVSAVLDEPLRRGSVPDGADGSVHVSTLDLGDHRLRDLGEPEHLYQVLHADCALQQHPALVSLESRPNNLVQMPGSFVGRDSELGELKGLLTGAGGTRHRLVTVIAPGGYGKSRLIAQLCANLLDEFGSGVFEVRLASLTEPSRVPEAIASATGFQFYGSREPRQQILDYLREKQMLLHFDNFEHLLPAAELVTEILQTAPKVQMVVTSREPLRLREEKVYRLEPLPVEEGGDAQRLFMDRALMVRHDFELRPGDAAIVERICRSLDGVPLAIELAAAWVDSFSLDELAREMDHQLELTARMADVPERHRSVRASCDWSWQQLTDQQKSLLRRCSVFRGGFFFDAGEAVLGITGMPLRRALAELCDKSWLYTRELKWEENGQPTSRTRWQLRDAAAREYAWEKLLETRTPEEIAAGS